MAESKMDKKRYPRVPTALDFWLAIAFFMVCWCIVGGLIDLAIG